MSEPIYIVATESKQLTAIDQVAFSEIGIKERQDLEAWVIAHPQVLGEKLLIITSEFDRFDRSSRRLDVLALDKDGCLVIIELKLDLSRSFADQQAIRYAAFCSTLAMKQVVELLARFNTVSEEDARKQITVFLGEEELPELGSQPRIILAAGTLDDEELTSTVLWLRTFGVDISCVELKPYRLPAGEVILVPRTIIPLPEAKNYMIKVEQKQGEAALKAKNNESLFRLWRLIVNEFNALKLGITLRTPSARAQYLKIPVGHGEIHYEWSPLRSDSTLRIALHFEADDSSVNERRMLAIAAHAADIEAGITCPFVAELWGRSWATAEFRMPWNETMIPEDVAKEAARLMGVLIQRTKPLVRELANDG